MGALRQKRWRAKRQAGAPQEGPGGQQARGSPSSSPPAHSALLSDTSIDLSSRYDHRLGSAKYCSFHLPFPANKGWTQAAFDVR